jgi:hypothetical protein
MLETVALWLGYSVMGLLMGAFVVACVCAICDYAWNAWLNGKGNARVYRGWLDSCRLQEGSMRLISTYTLGQLERTLRELTLWETRIEEDAGGIGGGPSHVSFILQVSNRYRLNELADDCRDIREGKGEAL